MGWRGDNCWYCRADLSALDALTKISILPAEWLEMLDAEFDRHINAECISDPRTDFEKKAAERMAAEIKEAADEERWYAERGIKPPWEYDITGRLSQLRRYALRVADEDMRSRLLVKDMILLFHERFPEPSVPELGWITIQDAKV